MGTTVEGNTKSYISGCIRQLYSPVEIPVLYVTSVCVFVAEYVMSLAGMSEENFKEAITDQYSDLYWDEDLLHDMYEAVTGGEKIRRYVTLRAKLFFLLEFVFFIRFHL